MTGKQIYVLNCTKLDARLREASNHQGKQQTSQFSQQSSAATCPPNQIPKLLFNSPTRVPKKRGKKKHKTRNPSSTRLWHLIGNTHSLSLAGTRCGHVTRDNSTAAGGCALTASEARASGVGTESSGCTLDTGRRQTSYPGTEPTLSLSLPLSLRCCARSL